MKKVLITATVASMIDLFNMDNIKILQKMGYHVDVAANFKNGNVTSSKRLEEFKKELQALDVGIFDIDFSRYALDFRKHVQAIKSLREIFKNNKYDFVHTQTPVAGALTRIVANSFNIKTLYVAHGFHFFKGAPKKNWILFYPIEKILSNSTHTLITINDEDYRRAKKFNAKNLEYIPGVGIDVNFPILSDKEKEEKKESLNLSGQNVLISVGELSDRKNHKVVISALANIKELDFQYLIVGLGEKKNDLEDLIQQYDLQEKVKLLGYRKDIMDLLQISNIFVFPSYQEGLPKALMEAMASGLPSIVSNIRGNSDLIIEGEGGYLFDPDDFSTLSEDLKRVIGSPKLKEEFSEFNKNRIKDFSKEKVNSRMQEIYTRIN